MSGARRGTQQVPRFIKRSPMPASPMELWDWHAQPGSLARLIPPWESVRIVHWLDASGQPADGLLADGVRVTLEARIGPFRPRWVSLLQNVVPGEQFADVQIRGPFASWRHSHRFLPAEDGTGKSSVLEDEIEYRLPAGSAGQFLAGNYVGRRIQRMFDYRHRITLEAMRALRGV